MELPICEFCKNTGVHFCPDVVESILVRCSHKKCPVTALQDRISTLEPENVRLRAGLVQIQYILKSRHLSDQEINLAALSEATWTLGGGD